MTGKFNGLANREPVLLLWDSLLKGYTTRMNRDELLSRITINPKVCFGKPCIRGHRIWVPLILDFLASGMSVEEVLEEYPDLNHDDILACIDYGAEMSRERYVEIPVESSR